jgi:hypothetical protein
LYDEKNGENPDTSEGDDGMKKLLKLQLFAEGSAGAGATGTGSSGAGEGAVSGVARPGGEGLSNVVYGKPSGEVTDPKKGKAADNPETLEARFEDMIKGEFKDVFAKRTQSIIDERFKKTKGIEEKLKSLDPILNTLAEKYGTDASDIEGLLKAVDEDESFYQRAAMEEGLTVKQYKEIRAMERQNKELLAEKQQQEEQAAIDQIYADWDRQAKEFAETYGIEGFNLMDEIQNPQFANLLKAGVTVDGAYKAVHFDDMVGGAMAHTAAKVKQDIVNSVNGRAQRPSEGAVASHNATVFKSDVSSLTKEDRAEIRRRAARGETIAF